MTATTELPTWAVYAVSLGSPALAFLGATIGHFLSRRGATELETRSRREEVMRSLRWAAELAVAEDERKSVLGVAQLGALAESELLGVEEQRFIDAALGSVLEEPVEELEGVGEEARVIHVVISDSAGVTDQASATVRSEEQDESERGGDAGG